MRSSSNLYTPAMTTSPNAERDKDELLEELRSAVAARDEFIAIAAHELRNPMTPMVAQVQLLRSRAERENASEAIKKGLDTLQLAVDHYLRRATTLLEISRLNTGNLRLLPTRTDLSRLIRECCRRHEQLAAYAGCSLGVHTPPSVQGNWDELAIEQILDNLVSNALRYGDGKPIRIELEATASDVEIRVADRGIGIAPDDRARIFDRFERAVPRGGSGGFGIGLWLANQLALAHGGSIDVRSEVGQGSTFTVRLPREG